MEVKVTLSFMRRLLILVLSVLAISTLTSILRSFFELLCALRLS